ncbi:MAG: urate hydroxylase PuuD [Parvularculaceae bacterium]
MASEIMPWIELALRWAHVLAGISWIGTSFYFVWLDNSLRPPPEPKPGVGGELWAVHGGGFYHKQKYVVAPPVLPEHLHWFKWEAYFTWISGILLFSVIYYLGAELFLIDRAKLGLTDIEAIALSLAFMAGGWVVYDGVCRSPLGNRGDIFAVVWAGVLMIVAYALGRMFSDRAAFMQVGAMVGTVMAANVFMVIIPNQRKATAAMLAGKAPDPALGLQAKQRSLHNNYMTLPVVLIMISGHYPMLWSGELAWLILAGLGAAGFLVRHFFNLKNRGASEPLLLAGAAAAFAAVAVIGIESQKPAKRAGAPARFSEAQAIVERHCSACHAAAPTHSGYPAPAAGLDLTSPEAIRLNAPRILLQAVDSDIMPLGNETGMTEEERAALGAWIRAGAKLEAGL